MENRVIWMSEDIEAERKRLDEENIKLSVAFRNTPVRETKRSKKQRKALNKYKKKYKGVENYKLYLKTDWWKERRKKYWKYHPKKCYCCGGVATDIHHNNYSHLFEERDKDFVPLCNNCHREVHALQKITGKLKNNHKIIKERHNKKTYV